MALGERISVLREVCAPSLRGVNNSVTTGPTRGLNFSTKRNDRWNHNTAEQ